MNYQRYIAHRRAEDRLLSARMEDYHASCCDSDTHLKMLHCLLNEADRHHHHSIVGRGRITLSMMVARQKLRRMLQRLNTISQLLLKRSDAHYAEMLVMFTQYRLFTILRVAKS